MNDGAPSSTPPLAAPRGRSVRLFELTELLVPDPAEHRAHGAELEPMSMFVLATLLTLPVAALSWHLLEKPLLGLKSRFEKPPVTSR